jgi:hypothetical protein
MVKSIIVSQMRITLRTFHGSIMNCMDFGVLCLDPLTVCKHIGKNCPNAWQQSYKSGKEIVGPTAVVLLEQALCGLRSSIKSFRNFLASNLREMVYGSTQTDADLRTMPDTR